MILLERLIGAVADRLPEDFNPFEAGLDPRQWVHQKWFAAVMAVLAVGVLAFGLRTWYVHQPLPMPATVQEGLAQLDSARYQNMPDYRQREYRLAVATQLQAMPQEDRRALMENQPELRESLMQMRRDGFSDQAFRFAAASEQEREAMLSENPWAGGRMGPRPEGGARPEGGQRPEGGARPEGAQRGEGGWQRPDPEQMTPDERAEFEQRRAERRQIMRTRTAERFQTGNPQETALVMEYFRARREARQARQNN